MDSLSDVTPQIEVTSTIDPFSELTPIASPLLLPSDFKLSQFKNYKLRVASDDILIDLYGNGGRVLTLTTSEFYKSKHYQANTVKNTYRNTILWRIREYKINYGLEIIDSIINDKEVKDKVVNRNRERLVYFKNQTQLDPNDRKAYDEAFKGCPEIAFDGAKRWNLRAYGYYRDKVGSAYWNREDEIIGLTKMFLDPTRFSSNMALLNPEAAREIAQKQSH